MARPQRIVLADDLAEVLRGALRVMRMDESGEVENSGPLERLAARATDFSDRLSIASYARRVNRGEWRRIPRVRLA